MKITEYANQIWYYEKSLDYYPENEQVIDKLVNDFIDEYGCEKMLELDKMINTLKLLEEKNEKVN